jgi:hypothetical protein
MQEWLDALQTHLDKIAETTPGYTHQLKVRMEYDVILFDGPVVLLVCYCTNCALLDYPLEMRELYDPRMMTMEWAYSNVPHFATSFSRRAKPGDCRQRLVDAVMDD